MTPAEKPKRHGCLFWGGIIAGILLLLVVLAGYAGYRYVRHVIYAYTDTQPLEMPTVQMSGTEITNLQKRVKIFDTAIKADKPAEPLILTADEINALIAENTQSNSASPVHLYFSFNDDHVQAKLSMPTDGFGLRMLKGRYFNGSGEFAMSLHNGKLVLTIQSLSVKGKPLPDQFMQSLRAENFADSWTNDPDFNQGVAKLQEMKIENGKLIVIPKMNATNSAPNTESPK
jgi:hypothetical protein